jgi:hypothetical protein
MPAFGAPKRELACSTARRRAFRVRTQRKPARCLFRRRRQSAAPSRRAGPVLALDHRRQRPLPLHRARHQRRGCLQLDRLAHAGAVVSRWRAAQPAPLRFRCLRHGHVPAPAARMGLRPLPRLPLLLLGHRRTADLAGLLPAASAATGSSGIAWRSFRRSPPPNCSTGCRSSSELTARNFLAPDSINDRFFTVLVFIHIGVPILMLILGLWAHVNRISPYRPPADAARDAGDAWRLPAAGGDQAGRQRMRRPTFPSWSAMPASTGSSCSFIR